MLEIDDIAEVVADAVKTATAPLHAQIAALETRELLLPEKGDPGEPGKSVEASDVAAMVEMAVKSAVVALPVPQDGAPGNDGPGFVDALIDASGALVMTRTDGTIKTLGEIKGRDGIGFAEAFSDAGRVIIRMTDGSEFGFDVPEPIDLCPDDTCELVAVAQRTAAEMPAFDAPVSSVVNAEPAKQLPFTLNISPGGATPVPVVTTKTITTRRDSSGNLVADVVERSG